MVNQVSTAKSTEFWTTPTETLLASLASDKGGLTRAQAERRFAQFGPNRFEVSQSRSILRKILQRLTNPLFAMLIVAAAVSGATGDVGSFAIIVIVVTLSLTLDIVQEHHAELAAEALRQSVAVQADVVRDGHIVMLPVSAIVPGDVVHLRSGDLVPADGVVLSARGAQVNESLLTGEAFPATKDPAPCHAKSIAEASNALFASTSMVGGEAVMLVVETGLRTRFGAIAKALTANLPPSALEEGVHRLGLLILRLTIFLCFFVLLAHLAAHRPAIESILFAVALAVGLTPELLPMVMTVTLSRGAQRMARRKVIVKRLSAIHDLGAMDTICVDKTGTLTEARIALVGHVNAEDKVSDRVLELAYVNSRFQTGIRSPLDDALLQAVASPPEGWSAISEIPFDFRRRRLSVLVAHEGQNYLIVKGAPEAIMERAVAVEVDGLARPLDEHWRAKLDEIQDRYSRDGFRLLGVAIKELPAEQMEATVADETDLTLAGLCIFADPPKHDAADALKTLGSLGVKVKIISGDHPAVVAHVAEAVGMAAQPVMTGAEIAGLSDSGLGTRLGQVSLFARIDPDQKKRIIQALRDRGHVVGFMGDGVNDAPAIHAAHVGISVSGATEVARAAADMILLAPDLSVLAAGVQEGRRTFANILKYVRMGTSSNFGNMLSMALASLALPFFPLLPLQILLNNLLYDLSEIGIPFDEVDHDDVYAPHGWDMTSLLRFTVIMGATSSLFDVATFVTLLKLFDADAALFQTGWFLESIATQILVIFLIRSRRLPWRANRPASVLIASSLGALAAAIFLAVGPFAHVFGFVAVPSRLAATVAIITAAYLAAAELAKRFALRR
ncbi:MAG TPA: magnesium-translocating P-type ATPase [Bradyrhizobium sp.]|uniref:magnesium-translocating P-type ATPase n=1 Tax=Bradyrhizobium sp. TaxID=376 RepID=UPI002C7CF4D2|nr:magnesium-translocating P-type ATPase [Bradyrhizobium sp.]HLZ01147.1 magnesium-translocating P-type ATPase [Bradyrhizobium sp.]